MKLVTYESAKESRVGVVEGGFIVDVEMALGLFAKGRISNPKLAPAVYILREGGDPPRDMMDLLRRGRRYRRALAAITKDLAEAPNPKPKVKGLFTTLASARLRAPIARPGKITCVGLNYADHAREQGIEPPKSPIFFLKSENTICGPGDKVRIPPNSAQVDYEAEFAVVIGKGGSRIPEVRALEHNAGYMLRNGVTARDFQFSDKQWFRGKSGETFAPTGPWIATRDEVPDPHNLHISLTLNGATMQDSNTSNLIFKVPYLVSYLSQSITLQPGDVISTGTPPGVGVFRKPQVFLKAGDTMTVAVEKLGELTNTVVGP